MRHEISGVGVLGHSITDAVSLAQEVGGAQLRGAGRRWGKISGAGGHGAEGSGAGSVSPKISTNIPNIFVFVGTNK